MFQTNVAKKIKTHNLRSILFSEKRVVYEKTWKNIVEPDRPQMTIRRIRFARWITKATDAHSEHVICIAFPLQQRLNERASLLRYTYIASLVKKRHATYHIGGMKYLKSL